MIDLDQFRAELAGSLAGTLAAIDRGLAGFPVDAATDREEPQ